MACANMTRAAIAFTGMAYVVMATHIIKRVVWPGAVPRCFPMSSAPCSIAVQFSSEHRAWPRTNTRARTRTLTRIRARTHKQLHAKVGLHIQVQLPESFGNLSALKELYLEGCTGLVHTCHTTCMHAHICMHCTVCMYLDGQACQNGMLLSNGSDGGVLTSFFFPVR